MCSGIVINLGANAPFNSVSTNGKVTTLEQTKLIFLVVNNFLTKEFFYICDRLFNTDQSFLTAGKRRDSSHAPGHNVSPVGINQMSGISLVVLTA